MSTGFIYQRSIIRVISTCMYLSEVTEPQCLKKKKKMDIKTKLKLCIKGEISMWWY